MRRRIAASVLLATLALAACSGDDQPDPTDATVAPQPELAVDQVAPAIAAVEAELGGPQRYFEINVQGEIVNLFVAVDDGAAAQPFAYVGGELSSIPAQAAQGVTFPSSSVAFDADALLVQVRAELPDAVEQALEIVGGPNDTVRYTVVLVSSGGSQILVEVAADGTIIAVDA